MLPADALRVIVRTPDVRVRVIARMPAVIRAVHVIARMPTVIRAVHVIVRKQKRCCPLVLSEVSHEHSTTADSRSESGSASYITWSPHHGIALSYRVEESPHLLKTSARSSMMV